MITRSSIAFEDFQGSSIAPQVMPPWPVDNTDDDYPNYNHKDDSNYDEDNNDNNDGDYQNLESPNCSL